MTNELKMQFPSGQQHTLLHNIMDLNKHFIVMLHRNVGPGMAGARGGGGVPSDPWPGQDFKEKIMGCSMTRVVFQSPRHAFSKLSKRVTYYMLKCA